MIRYALLAATLALATPAAADGHRTAAAEGTAVYFVGLEDGATVRSPVTINFGLRGMGVAPAGAEIENTGHHHLLIDRPAFGEGEADEADFAILNDDNHRHFGGGQTEVTLDLPPGEHTLQLVLGDAGHVAHAEPVTSERITITVAE
ncbi:DUF4399 domain-containing protein [Jannaschia sp. Os4]|uniref:DUF4399 domain-containing protein n=1 Tax=Jannaschia sp. Os4 TaxID=2807617 RepID=UPI00193A6E5F|nr:DUF4399 domain-containing protein [Jannaschia sp. Os4]MBM2574969.1 DUF4399 domain-containing protein [Jannaschia sp. Os4]